MTGSGESYSIWGTNASNGKNNSNYISSCTTSGNAFEACSNYKDKDTNLTGSYATGWYLPSLKELWTVRQNKTAVIASLKFLNTAYLQEGSSDDFQHYVSQGQKTYGYWCSNTTDDSGEMKAWIVRLDSYDKETSNTYTKDLIQKGEHSLYEYVMPIHEVTF